jgi:hypothetical protein
MTEFHWQFYMLSILGNLRRRKRPHHGCTLRDPLRCLEPRSCAGAAPMAAQRRGPGRADHRMAYPGGAASRRGSGVVNISDLDAQVVTVPSGD